MVSGTVALCAASAGWGMSGASLQDNDRVVARGEMNMPGLTMEKRGEGLL